MLTINIKQVLLNKGIARPFTFLRRVGISKDMAHKLLKGTYHRLDLEAIHKICYTAWCTPNDLLVWTPPNPVSNIPNHPLQAMKAKQSFELLKKIQKLSPEQMSIINNQLTEMTTAAAAKQKDED